MRAHLRNGAHPLAWPDLLHVILRPRLVRLLPQHCPFRSASRKVVMQEHPA
jgi:hypothetical protein